MTAPLSYTVRICGVRAGTLRRDGNRIRFRLEDAYRRDPRRPVLGLRFEDRREDPPGPFPRLPCWFGNLLPEGRLREQICRVHGVSAERETELLSRLGRDLPGAVTVEQESDEPGASAPGRPGPDHAVGWRFSLAGVGLKFSMLRRSDRLTLPGADELGDWIVKLPDAVHPRVPANELAMMRLAGRIGIRVPETRLVHREQLPELPAIAWPSGEEHAYAIRRFDRTADGGRVHMEDFAQVRGFAPERKYEGSFDTIGALVSRGQPGNLEDLREFARRLAFNILVGNGDAHLKNWSLLYPDGRLPRLAPAYDLVSTAPYMPAGDPEDMGLKLRGSRRFEQVSRRDFDRLAEKLGASGAALGDVVAETVARFREVWDPWSPELSELPEAAEWIDRRLPHIARTLLR